MDISVRPADAGDILQMCDLLYELFSIESDFCADSQKQARGLKLLLSDATGTSIVLVAARGEEIMGMCSVQTLISTSEGGPAGLLEDFVVRKDHRGNGIGTRLISEIFRWCKTKNISRLQLLRDADNERAMKLYACNGLTDTNLVCMRKIF